MNNNTTTNQKTTVVLLWSLNIFYDDTMSFE